LKELFRWPASCQNGGIDPPSVPARCIKVAHFPPRSGGAFFVADQEPADQPAALFRRTLGYLARAPLAPSPGFKEPRPPVTLRGGVLQGGAAVQR
jgi:hypothetical protein